MNFRIEIYLEEGDHDLPVGRLKSTAILVSILAAAALKSTSRAAGITLACISGPENAAGVTPGVLELCFRR